MRGEGNVAPLSHTCWWMKAPWHCPLCTQIGCPLLFLGVEVIYMNLFISPFEVWSCRVFLDDHTFTIIFIQKATSFSRSPTSRNTSHSNSSKRKTESRSHKQKSKSRRSRTQSPPRRRSSPTHRSSNRHQSRPHSPRSRRHRYMHCRTEKLVCTFTSAIYFSTSWTIRSLISETLPSFFCCFSMYFHSLLQLNAPTHSTHLEW